MNIVFIVGAPRSGTTWLQLLLSQSDRISTSQETHLFNGYLSYLNVSWKNYASYNRKVGLHSVYTEDEFLELKRKISNEVFMKILCNKPSANIVLEKTPDHIYYWRDILELYPDAYFIHIVRDPRSVVASMRATGAQWKNPWVSAGITELSRNWLYAATESRRMLAATPRAREVHYEEIAKNGPALLNELWSWLGVPESPEIAQQAFSTFSFEKLARHESKPRFEPWDINKEPDLMWRKGKSDSWKTELSQDEIALIENICSPLMQELGYKRETNRGLPVKFRMYFATEWALRSMENYAREAFRSYRSKM